MNICAAVIGDDFKTWVQSQIEDRNALMASKKEIMISMDPDMATKFAASTHFSSKFILIELELLTVISYSHERHICEHAQDEQ